MFALWPGIFVRWLLKLAGISTPAQFVFWPTLLFWWLTVWLVLRFGLARSPRLAGPSALTCPFCTHQFPLTWRRYLTARFGRHVCPACGRRSTLGTGLVYWTLYAPLLLCAPFAALFIALLIYSVGFPQYSEDDVVWFLGSPWLFAAFIASWALILPMDRALTARFLKLQAPKGSKN